MHTHGSKCDSLHRIKCAHSIKLFLSQRNVHLQSIVVCFCDLIVVMETPDVGLNRSGISFV